MLARNAGAREVNQPDAAKAMTAVPRGGLEVAPGRSIA